MQASPRNSLLGYLSDKLATGKGYANKYEILPQIPLLGGTGLGDLFLGKSPELLDDMSYNMSSAIRGGNRATGGLGTYTLDKRSADLGMTMADMYGLSKGLTSLGKYGAKKLIDKSGFDETRRAFLEGKAKGLEEPTNDTVSTSIDAINEVLQKPISRRDLMKKSAIVAGGGAALAATPSLLRNFAKEAEHTIPKVAEHAADNVAVNTVKKYKYNTLKDYLDEVTQLSEEYGFYKDEQNDALFKLLKDDEYAYETAKRFKEKYGSIEGYHNSPQGIWDKQHGFDATSQGTNLQRVDEFSPQAKQEMKALKQVYGNDWYHPNIHDEVLSNGFGFGDSKNPLKDLQDIKANSGGTGYDTFMDNINYGNSIF